MDELELLKKDWKKKDGKFKELSYSEIYKIIHKKSSSIVKWIFIISIAEFVFWGIVNFFIPDSIYEVYDKFHLRNWLYISYVVHYIIVIWFIYKFYTNFKAIHIADSTKLLMKKIIKTRKTVNYYVYYVIIYNFILSIIFTIIMFSKSDIMLQILNPKNLDIDENKLFMYTLIIQIVVIFVMCGILWLYYRIIYGILLKKLNRNYNELERIE